MSHTEGYEAGFNDWWNANFKKRVLNPGGFARLVWRESKKHSAISAMDSTSVFYTESEGSTPSWRATKQRDELLAAAEAIEINAEECMDFDDCTAMLVPIDDYHKLMEAIAGVKGGA